MPKIIDIRSRLPHIEGKAVCLSCRHHWRAVTEIGAIELECPECKLSKGVWDSLPTPDKVWQCKCSCIHFFVNDDGAHCCLCGLTQTF